MLLLNLERMGGLASNVESMTGVGSPREDTLKLTLRDSHSPALFVRKPSHRGTI